MKTRFAFLLAPVTLVLTAGCGGGGGNDAGSATTKIVSDTAVMKEAEAAANEVIRSTGDCDAVRAAYADAIAKLDEVESRVQTQAGRTTLQTLRKQVTTAGEACGIR